MGTFVNCSSITGFASAVREQNLLYVQDEPQLDNDLFMTFFRSVECLHHNIVWTTVSLSTQPDAAVPGFENHTGLPHFLRKL